MISHSLTTFQIMKLLIESVFMRDIKDKEFYEVVSFQSYLTHAEPIHSFYSQMYILYNKCIFVCHYTQF